MALKIGSKAPDIRLLSTSDKVFHLKDFLGKPLILFFYPKDFTKGCTAEACEFRDQFSEFRDMEVPVFGISRDDIPTHEKFKKAYKLPFELLSDPDGKVCKSYDALIPVLKIPKRVTYLLDSEQRIAGIFEGLFENKKHVSAMIAQLGKS
ncbi:peroxiredoxin [Algoriphagus aestuariicola]|uniref:thioredoxin-dependent peroxiredoxin n=1 Tax=Algoriphagus aestuariicola TaxID=1852016 RepID=A0ABS3BPA1_9BACT|nr:peroxiredoxin [Algoriphagus aestuariicola]MBN7800885.1 peroxiredoxin [Algoriphagus aestuariicola]